MTNQIPPNLKWVEIAVKFLSALEKLLPAILVSYNNHLKSKVAAIGVRAELAETKWSALEAEIKIDHDARSLGRRALLERALSRRRDPAAK